MAQHNTLFPLVILGGALLFGSCDPMKQIVVENRTSGPLVFWSLLIHRQWIQVRTASDPVRSGTSFFILGIGNDQVWCVIKAVG